jgi:hypothetical protein
LREHIRLVLRVALYGVYQIWNEIRTPLQLHLDLPLRAAGLLIELLNAIVTAPGAREEQRNCEPLSSHREVASLAVDAVVYVGDGLCVPLTVCR